MTDNIEDKPPSAWRPEQDLVRLAVYGKALEELGELSSIIARCMIQGVEECEPETGVPNRIALGKEVADVYSRLEQIVEIFDLDTWSIARRSNAKTKYHKAWLNMLAGMG